MALIFGTLFKLINCRGNLKSAILMDEAPTVVIKGLDTLIATARSNEVAVVLGGQDTVRPRPRRREGLPEAPLSQSRISSGKEIRIAISSNEV